METIDFSISGFKCFENQTFKLNNITLFTGANASGKSSVIQSLLLVKASDVNPEIDLNDKKYAFAMGDKDSLVNVKTISDDIEFILGDNRYYFKVSDDSQFGKLKMYFDNVNSIIPNNFYYLSAEREGPRFDVLKDESVKIDCGCNGHNTANVISNNEQLSLHESRCIQKEREKFFIQLDYWIDYIFPGVSVRTKLSGANRRQVIIRSNSVSSVAPNVGFGISYVLPIIVEGLLVENGSWLVVENPEAHLHAKAQSNMGYFLAFVASAGIRVILETHSEHIVNGIRRAVVDPNNALSNDNVNIYFMTPEKIGEAQLIRMDNEGNLDDFPIDFFDQTRQDLKEMYDILSNCKIML